MNIIPISLAALVPFSYYSHHGLRVAAFGALLVYFVLFLCQIFCFRFNSFLVYRHRYSFSFAYIILMFAIISLAVSGNPQFIFSYLLFMMFMLWPFLLRKKDFTYINYKYIIKIYVIGVIFCAVGVLFQVYSFFILGNEVFRVALFGGGRIAFGFLWSDFSFLSLYFVSAIPLVFILFTKRISIFVSVLLLVASVLTSARTGIAALILFFCCYLIYALFRSTATGKLSKQSIYFGISTFIIVILFVFVLSVIGVRQVTLASSGRVESVMQAINYWMAFPLFGSLMDPVRYDSGVIPHHIITYSLVMGGLVFSSIFFLWLLSAYHIIYSKNKFIFYSIVIALLGFNFIPSFFSAYFLAFLFSLSIFHGQVYRNIS